MFIHRVTGRESTQHIAELYGTTAREIVRLNELETQDELISGINLLVPGAPYLATAYTVQSGDTAESIAERTGLPKTYIERWTGIYSAQGGVFKPGSTIYLPKLVQAKKAIETNAFIVPDGKVDDARVLYDLRDITYLSVFSFQAKADGSLAPLNDKYAIEGAKRIGTLPMLTLTNFDGERFDPMVLTTLFTNASVRKRLIDSVTATAKERGYRGVTIDFEHIQAKDRDAYSGLVRELATALKSQKLASAVVLQPKSSGSATHTALDALDYRALGAEVDFVCLMTYEWGWAGGPPQAVAPYPKVAETLRYATSVIPASKIMLGMVLYGYDWRMRGTSGQSEPGASLSNNSAQNLAVERKTPVLFDTERATPFYRYTVDTESHEVWYEDALSTALKLELVYQYQLRGVSFWVLPNSSPQTWYLLRDSFTVRKLS